MPLEGCNPPDTTWKADEACCEWTGAAPSGDADCPGDATAPGLGFVAATGLCENTAFWASGSLGTIPFFATDECYSDVEGAGAFWSQLCQDTFPAFFGNWDGCQCRNASLVRIGCPSVTALQGYGAGAPFYGFGVRSDTGCCGEPRVWGCPQNWEPERGAGAADHAAGQCEASDPGDGYEDNCIPQCFTPAPCPPGWTRDPDTGFCIEPEAQLWPAVLVTRWGEYYRVDCPEGNLYFRRASHIAEAFDHEEEVTSTGDDSRPSLARGQDERTWILFARAGDGVYEVQSDTDGMSWKDPVLSFAGGTFSEQRVNPHTGARLAAALVGNTITGAYTDPAGVVTTYDFKQLNDVALVLDDADGFAFDWVPSASEELAGAFHIDGETEISNWKSDNDGRNWLRVT